MQCSAAKTILSLFCSISLIYSPGPIGAWNRSPYADSPIATSSGSRPDPYIYSTFHGSSFPGPADQLIILA